jgi:hypothetical protein
MWRFHMVGGARGPERSGEIRARDAAIAAAALKRCKIDALAPRLGTGGGGCARPRSRGEGDHAGRRHGGWLGRGGGHGNGLGLGNRLTLDLDPGDGGFNRHHLVARDQPLDEDAVLQGGDFDGGLVAFDFEQRFAAPEFLTRALDDEADAAFLHRLPQAGERHLDHAAHDGAILLTSQRPVSAMSCTEGTAPRSSAGDTGMGMSSPATRTTGSSR